MRILMMILERRLHALKVVALLSLLKAPKMTTFGRKKKNNNNKTNNNNASNNSNNPLTLKTTTTPIQTIKPKTTPPIKTRTTTPTPTSTTTTTKKNNNNPPATRGDLEQLGGQPAEEPQHQQQAARDEVQEGDDEGVPYVIPPHDVNIVLPYGPPSSTDVMSRQVNSIDNNYTM